MQNAECKLGAFMISKGPALRDQVYSHIRDRIVSGTLEPGRVIVEVELAAELNVSRTPVSNALVMLKERGLLEDDGGKLKVPILKLEDVIDLYWCRMAHDGLASRLAAERIGAKDLKQLETYLRAWETPEREDDLSALWVSDLNFHHLIYRVAGNRHLLRFSELTTELVSVYRRNTIRRMTDPTSGTNRSRNDVRAEHEAIYEAIASRNPDAAEEAARFHIRMVIQHLEQADLVIQPEQVGL
ncbi:MAG: GntR family transcriptional regulator [Meiothermus sp.]|nr:MAG: GntR family transcriptional regulator [Meiothermus sp.]